MQVCRDCEGLLKLVCNTWIFVKYFAFALVELEFNEIWNLVNFLKQMSSRLVDRQPVNLINLIAL